ncbi:MAG: pentapeptide repeat-containing protein [Nitrosotalea sp.]
MTNANFDGVNMQGVDLGSTILTGAHLHCSNNPVCN